MLLALVYRKWRQLLKGDEAYVQRLARQANIFSIILAFLQTVTISTKYALNWPPRVQRVMDWIGAFVMLDLFTFMAPECIIKLSFEVRWGIQMVSPLLFLGIAVQQLRHLAQKTALLNARAGEMQETLDKGASIEIEAGPQLLKEVKHHSKEELERINQATHDLEEMQHRLEDEGSIRAMRGVRAGKRAQSAAELARRNEELYEKQQQLKKNRKCLKALKKREVLKERKLELELGIKFSTTKKNALGQLSTTFLLAWYLTILNKSLQPLACSRPEGLSGAAFLNADPTIRCWDNSAKHIVFTCIWCMATFVAFIYALRTRIRMYSAPPATKEEHVLFRLQLAGGACVTVIPLVFLFLASGSHMIIAIAGMVTCMCGLWRRAPIHYARAHHPCSEQQICEVVGTVRVCANGAETPDCC
jgi:hypothetical protein